MLKSIPGFNEVNLACCGYMDILKHSFCVIHCVIQIQNCCMFFTNYLCSGTLNESFFFF